MNSRYATKAEIKSVLAQLTAEGYQFKAKLIADQLARKQDRLVLRLKTSSGQNLVLKCLLNYSAESQTKFEKELALLDVFNQEKQIPFQTNVIIKVVRKPLLWVMMSFAEGDIAGNIFEFQSSLLDESLADFLTETLFYFQRHDDNFDLKQSIKATKIQVSGIIAKIDFPHPLAQYQAQLTRIMAANFNYLADPDNYVFCHHDLSPLNIIKTGKGYAVIDWELAGGGIKTFDAAYLYQRAWFYPGWQKSFSAKIFNQILVPEDRANFDFWLLLLLVLDIDILKVATTTGYKFKHGQIFLQTDLKKRFAFYLNLFQEIISHY